MRPLVFAVFIGSRPPLVAKRPDPVPVVHTATLRTRGRSERLLDALDIGSVLGTEIQHPGSGVRCVWTTEDSRALPAASSRFTFAMVLEAC
jgi:hypothetical protein